MSPLIFSCSKKSSIRQRGVLDLPPVLPLNNWILSSSSAGHSPQRCRDVSSTSPQILQVDGRDSLHLDR